MPHPLHDVARDPETEAAIRRLCDGRKLASRCRKAACRRAGRCRAAWREDPPCPAIVLPPCLLDAYDALLDAMIRAQEAVENLERDIALARAWPDPDEPAED